MKKRITLRDVVRIEARIVDPTSESTSFLPHVSAENIRPVTGELLRVQSAAEDGMESGKYQFDGGDVLYSKLRPYLRKAAIAGFPGLCSADMYPLKVDAREIDAEYLRALLVSDAFTSYSLEVSTRTRMPKLNRDQIYAFEFEAPAVDRQRSLVARLKMQFATVAELREAAKAEVLAMGSMVARVREEALASLNGAKRIALGAVLKSIETGKSFQTTERLARDDELGVLKVSAVSWGEFNPHEAKAVATGHAPDERHRVKAGDLLISRANTLELVGAVVRVDRDYPLRLLSDKTLRLVPDETRVRPEYLAQVLRLAEAREHIEANATGTSSSMRNISQDTLRATPIPLIPTSAQDRMTDRMSRIADAAENARRAMAQRAAEIERLPARLLADAFES